MAACGVGCSVGIGRPPPAERRSSIPSDSPQVDWTQRVLRALELGEDEAAREIVERFGAELLTRARHYVRRYSLPGCAPEDLVQDAWTTALAERGIRRFRRLEPGKLLPWLLSVLHHRALDRLGKARALKRGASESRRSLDLDGGDSALGNTLPSEDTSPTSRARFEDLVALCWRVLNRREWDVWQLVEIEGRTAVEAAGMLGISDSATRSLIHRAREKLIRELAEPQEPSARDEPGEPDAPGVDEPDGRRGK